MEKFHKQYYNVVWSTVTTAHPRSLHGFRSVLVLSDAVSALVEFGNLRSSESTFNWPWNGDVMHYSHVVSYHSARALAVQSWMATWNIDAATQNFCRYFQRMWCISEVGFLNSYKSTIGNACFSFLLIPSWVRGCCTFANRHWTKVAINISHSEKFGWRVGLHNGWCLETMDLVDFLPCCIQNT